MHAATNEPRDPKPPNTAATSEPRPSLRARVQNLAHDLVEKVRKALGDDSDRRPPGFNGLMLVA